MCLTVFTMTAAADLSVISSFQGDELECVKRFAAFSPGTIAVPDDSRRQPMARVVGHLVGQIDAFNFARYIRRSVTVEGASQSAL
jgi:hypothetical protein